MTPYITPVTVNDCDSFGVCWICNDPTDHGGQPHGLATGDGLDRYAILDNLASVERGAVRALMNPCLACNGVNGYHFLPCRGRNGVVLSPVSADSDSDDPAQAGEQR